LQWVEDKQKKDPVLYERLGVISGDFDNDVETPDNVIIQNNGKDLYVDGYQIVPGRNKVFKENVQLEHPLDKDRWAFYTEPNYLYLKKFFRKSRSEISKYSSSQEWYTQDQTNNPQRYNPDTYLGACVLMRNFLGGIKWKQHIPLKVYNPITLLKTYHLMRMQIMNHSNNMVENNDLTRQSFIRMYTIHI
jgi:hypothetical protein